MIARMNMRKIEGWKTERSMKLVSQMFESIDFYSAIDVKDDKISFHLDVALGYWNSSFNQL
jgi:hypothetical protein